MGVSSNSSFSYDPASALDGDTGWDEDTVYASGVVPWRMTAASNIVGQGEIEILLIHRPRYDDWSVPKGKRDPGESDEQCAVREMNEETGILAELGEPLPTVLYVDHKGRNKEVAYWLMRIDDGEPLAFEPNDEVDKVRWFTLAKARQKLTYPIDQALLDEASLILGKQQF